MCDEEKRNMEEQTGRGDISQLWWHQEWNRCMQARESQEHESQAYKFQAHRSPDHEHFDSYSVMSQLGIIDDPEMS